MSGDGDSEGKRKAIDPSSTNIRTGEHPVTPVPFYETRPSERLAIESSIPPRSAGDPTSSSMTRPSTRLSASDLEVAQDDFAQSRQTELAIQVPVELRERNRASLLLITSPNAGQVFPVDRDELVIGRGRDCQFRIDDVGISRQHSRILRLESDVFIIEDLNSTNGTYVGGLRTMQSELRSGDLVQIGPNVVLRFALVDEREDALARQLYESSTRDPLTRAFNRKYLQERLTAEIAYAVRHRTLLGIVLIDLDHFKQVNDTYGHLCGDEVLRSVSAHLGRLIRTEDVLARYGGEEFAIVARGIELKPMGQFADRLRRAIEKAPVAWESHTITQTISAGVAMLSEVPDRGSGEGVLLLADERLYRAKLAGRNRVCIA